MYLLILCFVYERQIIIKKNYAVKLLHNLGIPSHLDGYKYLKMILLENYNNNKKFYTFVEQKYKIDKRIIERSIRYAIEVGWNRANYKDIEEIFGNSIEVLRSKPTNLEFINAVLERLND